MNRKQRRTAAKTVPLSKGKVQAPAFFEALELYRAGRLAEAEAICRGMAEHGQMDTTTLRLLGSIAVSRRDPSAAIGYLGTAATLAPNDALVHVDLSVALRMAGRMSEAADASRAALALDPDNALAHNSLGIALGYLGQLNDAEKECRAAVASHPLFAEGWSDLGNALANLGRMDDAIDCHRKALSIKPSRPEAHGNLAVTLAAAGRLSEAEKEFRLVTALCPNDPIAHNNLGGVLEELGQHEEAEGECRSAVDLQPFYPEAWSNLGNTLTSLGRLDAAVDCFKRALAQRPAYADVLVNLGRALNSLHRTSEAADVCRSAIALKPDFAEAHNNLAMSFLLSGNLTEGWKEYEWRWRVRISAPDHREFSQPRWEGQPLAGCTLLLHGEQGYGDQLQFCRYANLAAKRGARVVLMVSRPLVRLLSTMKGIDQVISTDELPPPFDFHQSLMSMPRVMGTTLDSVPTGIPYLYTDNEDVAAWRKRLRRLPGLKVGLVWAGEPRVQRPRAHAVDRRRSIDPVRLLPLLSVPGASMVSLQMGNTAARIQALPDAVRPLEVMDKVRDFADTAAIIANLDLVISVDTSVAHLAGALGKPVWVLSRFDGCWRWLLERDDSPWYPTLRLFRQQAPGAWDELIGLVASALAEKVAFPT